MEMLSIEKELQGNSYPGRGIIIGKSADGTKAVTAYFIMGRSENSRNRVFVEEGEGIRTPIRNSDVVNHYSKGQYLVLLINTTREDCAVIQKRINYKFLTDRQRTGVRYYVNSVVYEKDL